MTEEIIVNFIEERLKNTGVVSKCRKCGKSIVFISTGKNRKPMPFSMDMTAHYLKCYSPNIHMHKKNVRINKRLS